MTTVSITTPAGVTDGTVELPDSIFDAQASIPLMHQVVTAQLAAARQGTHSTKTRGEVSGGGKKPYRQKGTGRARQGSTRSPQFVGGGISHGPQPRDYSQRTPKKMKAAALRGALSDRARGGNVHVLSSLVEGTTPSTKTARNALAAVSSAKNVLIVLSRTDEAGWLSLRNLPEVHLLFADQLNTYDVLISDDVVFTKTALDEFLSFQQVSVITSGELAELSTDDSDDESAVSLSKSSPALDVVIDDDAADEIDAIAPGTLTEVQEEEDDK